MKKITILLLGILLIFNIVAAVTLNNRNLEMKKEYKDALESIDLGNYNVTDYQVGDNIKRCLFKEDAINTCSGLLDSVEDANIWEQQRIEQIANATIQRQNKLTKEKISEGTTTIIEKK